MSAITLDYAFNATPPFTDTSVKNHLWQLLLRCDNNAFLVLAESWNFCSGKPSPEALPKKRNIPDSDDQIIWCGARQY